jgi:hypothetical protein
MQLFENEIIYSNIDPATVFWYWFTAFSFRPNKKITVTSQRILISTNWFGAESNFGGASYFYNEGDYNLDKGPMSNLIVSYSIGKSRFFGEYIKLIVGRGLIKPRIIISTNSAKRICEIIGESKLKTGS